MIDFMYAADFTNAAANIIGTTMDALSVQTGSAGNNGTMIANYSPTATSTAAGTWTGYKDKVSGNGCTAGSADSICYTVNPTAVGGDGAQIIAAALYKWTFSVVLKTGIDAAGALSGDHSIKFLSVKQNPNGKWSTGFQLSQSGRNTTTSTTVPEPSTLVLLGLGLAGLMLHG